MEEYVDSFLKKNNFNYKRQYKFNDLKDKGLLKFDFAIFDSNDNLKYLYRPSKKTQKSLASVMNLTKNNSNLWKYLQKN